MQAKRLPISNLAVETTTLAIKMAVTTQCTLAFGEGPGSWLSKWKIHPTQVTTSAAYSLLWKMLWYEKKRHVAWCAGPHNYVRPHACGCACMRPSLRIHNSSHFNIPTIDHLYFFSWLSYHYSVISFNRLRSTSFHSDISCLHVHLHIISTTVIAVNMRL